MTTLRIRPELREAIARAILDDDAVGNGEHLYDGERLLYYCPMQALEPALENGAPRVPVRNLLPPGLRVPTFADFIGETSDTSDAGPAVVAPTSSPDERQELSAAYESYALAWLVERLPESVHVTNGA